MIEYIKGFLTDLTPTYAVIEAAGVGYVAQYVGDKERTLQHRRQLPRGGIEDKGERKCHNKAECRIQSRSVVPVTPEGNQRHAS